MSKLKLSLYELSLFYFFNALRHNSSSFPIIISCNNSKLITVVIYKYIFSATLVPICVILPNPLRIYSITNSFLPCIESDQHNKQLSNQTQSFIFKINRILIQTSTCIISNLHQISHLLIRK